MSEDRTQNKKTDKAEYHVWYLWASLLVVFVVAIVCCFTWQKHLWNAGSIDEQLAAINSELAIPDSENAAVNYRRFFTDPNNAAILYDLSDQTPSAYCEPWADIEHPELAAKLKKHRTFMQKLLDISEMQKAHFPVYCSPGSISYQMLPDMRRVTFILSWQRPTIWRRGVSMRLTANIDVNSNWPITPSTTQEKEKEKGRL